MTRKVIYNCPYLGAPGAIHWIVSAWEAGFKLNDYSFMACDDYRLLPNICYSIKPDLLFCDIVATPLENETYRDLIYSLKSYGAKICFNVYWPMNDLPLSRIEAIKHYELADIYCGEREVDSMQEFMSVTGKSYVTIPQSANPRVHYPRPESKEFLYDIAFVGAKLPLKKWFNQNIIVEVKKNHNLGLFGPCWTIDDNILRALSKTARFLDLMDLARVVDSQRFSISEENECKLYASSKISLNFHERNVDYSQPHHIVNQRTFKIAACGGFQIVDSVRGIAKYFSDNEIVTAEMNSRDWMDKINYYLIHEKERKDIQQRGTEKALKYHMSNHRVELLEKILNIVR